MNMMEDRILLKKLILHALLNSTLFTIGGYFGIGLERSNVISYPVQNSVLFYVFSSQNISD